MIRNFAPGEYYHVFNRGNEGKRIFLDERDYIRMLFLILHFQTSDAVTTGVSYYVSQYIKKRRFNLQLNTIGRISRSRASELASFAIMPNHFHLLVCSPIEGGISSYMHRISMAYAKYFNAKYDTTGHVFQGTFKSVHIRDDRQLKHATAYIHRNPRDLRGWKDKEHLYEWSSYQDYVTQNRWGNLLCHDIVRGQFISGRQYKDFVESSGAKDKYVLDRQDIW